MYGDIKEAVLPMVAHMLSAEFRTVDGNISAVNT